MMTIVYRRMKIRKWKPRQFNFGTNNNCIGPTMRYTSSGGTSTQIGEGMKIELYFKSSIYPSTYGTESHLVEYRNHMTHSNSPRATKHRRAQTRGICLQGTIYSKPNNKVKIYVGHKTRTICTLIQQKAILFQNHPT